MKNEIQSFMIITSKSLDVSSLLQTVLCDFLKQCKIEYSFISKEDYDFILLINDDISEDLKETCESLLEDLDDEAIIFEGFRINKIKDVEKIYNCLKNHNYIGYLKMVDIALKSSPEEIQTLKEIIRAKIDNTYLKQIIFGMFKSNLNVSKAATIVYMHRNTINNKLDIIKKETGLDIQNFYESVAMYRLLK